MVRKRKAMENSVVGNDFENIRPCYKGRGGDICSKLIYGVLSKYNPALSDNDKYNDLQRVDYENHKLPRVGFNEAEVDYIFSISSSSNITKRRQAINNAIKKLITENIVIKLSGGGSLACPIFTLLKYTPEDSVNTLVAEINYNLLDLVLDFRGKDRLYTTVSLNDIRLLSSDYAIKIYTYCQRYSKIRNNDCYEIKVDTDSLKKYLGISNGYSTKSFNLKILDKYTNEITEKTSYNITYTKQFYGRKITGYVFSIKAKVPTKIRKHYEAGFACVNGIDSSLINVDNAETINHLSKMGVNKAQLIEAIKMGTTYLKFVTKEIDNEYKKAVKINRNVSYGALFWGAIKGWLNYEKWAQEHPEDIQRDKERLIELSNIKLNEIEASEAEKKAEKERVKLRSFFRNAIPMYKDLSDDELDNLINMGEKLSEEKRLAKEAEEAKKAEKAKKVDEAKTINPLIVDKFIEADFDVNKLLLSPFNSCYIDEQEKFGFDDFGEFVQYVKTISIQ